MSTQQNGGPAFPGLNAEFTGISSDGQERYEIQPSGGMTLRDYFAAKAMPGLMGRNWSNHKGTDEELIGVWARSSYAVADAMLKARGL